MMNGTCHILDDLYGARETRSLEPNALVAREQLGEVDGLGHVGALDVDRVRGDRLGRHEHGRVRGRRRGRCGRVGHDCETAECIAV